VKLEDISKDIVGKEFNGLFVTKVTDGTMDTVTEHIYRYKFPKRGAAGNYLRDKEEKVIVKDFTSQQFGAKLPELGGRDKVYGTELIDIFPAGFDEDLFKKTGIKRCNDFRVWWKEGHRHEEEFVDTHFLTQENIYRDKVVGGTHHVGTWQEFLDAVNKNEPGPEDYLPNDPLTPADIDFIKANYKEMSDAQMAKKIGATEQEVKEYRLKVLKLKKNV